VETGNSVHDVFSDFYCLIFVNHTTMTWRIEFLCCQQFTVVKLGGCVNQNFKVVLRFKLHSLFNVHLDRST
jgi:hypothetical protein